jgi:integrase
MSALGRGLVIGLAHEPKPIDAIIESCGDQVLLLMQVSAAYASALTKLAPRTVHHFHRVLSQALKQAVRWRLLLRNPCDDCDPPKLERREMQVWDVSTMVRALELARPWRAHVPVTLAALCGLRRGEIAALRWRHIDLDRAQLAVIDSAEQTRSGVRIKRPNNGKGRTVALPSIAVEELCEPIGFVRPKNCCGLACGSPQTRLYVRAKMANRSNRTRSVMHGIASWLQLICRAFDSTTFVTAMPPRCSPATFIQRSSASASATAGLR